MIQDHVIQYLVIEPQDLVLEDYQLDHMIQVDQKVLMIAIAETDNRTHLNN